jgi:hypothetical protein
MMGRCIHKPVVPTIFVPKDFIEWSPLPVPVPVDGQEDRGCLIKFIYIYLPTDKGAVPSFSQRSAYSPSKTRHQCQSQYLQTVCRSNIHILA